MRDIVEIVRPRSVERKNIDFTILADAKWKCGASFCRNPLLSGINARAVRLFNVHTVIEYQINA